jgi:hypothetical protein
MDVTLTFDQGYRPHLDKRSGGAETLGYRLLRDSLTITSVDNRPVWRFSVIAVERSRAVSSALLAEELASSAGVASFSVVPVRN